MTNSEIDSRDENGKYCGLVEATGEMAITPPDKCGYCGPDCSHCFKFRIYDLNSEGIWTCAADSDLVG